MSRSDPLTNAALEEQDRGTFLERSMRWWDVGYLLIFVVVAVVTVAVDLPISDKVAALGGLAVIVTAYAVFGRRQLLSETDCRIRNAMAYLLVLYTMALLISYFSDIGNLLFFVAFSSTWMILTVRWAIGGSVVLTLGIVFLNVAAAGWSPGAWAAGLAIGGGTAAAGVLLGLWITGVVEESERRNALIAELERTRTALGEAQHRAGAFAERERLAAEIHDTIAQGLLSIVVHTRAIEPDDPESESRIRRIEQIAQDNLTEARGLIEALQPAELREHSLPDACRRVCARVGSETGIEVRFRTEGEPRTLPANTEVVLLRATQEALTNVRKHAAAQHVDVLLTYRPVASPASDDGIATAHDPTVDTVRLTVTDDGAGFHVPDPGSASGSYGQRAGLRGMRNRAEQIDGRVEVHSSPGSGTRISVEVPS